MLKFTSVFLVAVSAVCVFGLSLPKIPSLPLKSASSPSSSSLAALPTMTLERFDGILSCFNLPTLTTILKDVITNPTMNKLINGTSNFNNVTNGDVSQGFFGNGEILCGDAWVGNATMMSPTCLVNGDQTVANDLVLSGNQTVLCGNLQDGYVQYLNGFAKFYMHNSADTPFDGWIQIGPLSKMRTVVNTQGIQMSYGDYNINLKFPGNDNDNDETVSASTAGSLVFV